MQCPRKGASSCGWQEIQRMTGKDDSALYTCLLLSILKNPV